MTGAAGLTLCLPQPAQTPAVGTDEAGVPKAGVLPASGVSPPVVAALLIVSVSIPASVVASSLAGGISSDGKFSLVTGAIGVEA